MPNWEELANQMAVPFGGVQQMNPQPVQQRPDMNALAQGFGNPLGVQTSMGPSTATFGPNQLYEAWPMSLAKIMVGMLTNKINPSEVWQGFKQSAVNPPSGAVMTPERAGEMALEGALMMQPGNLPGMMGQIKAFHGSPYKFDKFKAEKIGTGEGAQAFGHGLYFTSEKEIAKHYALGDKLLFDGEVMDATQAWNKAVKEFGTRGMSSEHGTGRILNRVIDDLKGRFGTKGNPYEVGSESAKLYDNLKSRMQLEQGQTYSVTLHKGKQPGEYDYLKWDEKVDESAKSKVLPVLSQIPPSWISVPKSVFASNKAFIKSNPDITGEQLYQMVSKMVGSDKRASELFLRAGIDGIEYPAGSLSGGGKGAKNWVVFDENAITIEGK